MNDPILDRRDHLVCSRCGQVNDTMGMEAPVLSGGFQFHNGFQVEQVTVQFSGLCGRCRDRDVPSGRVDPDFPNPAEAGRKI